MNFLARSVLSILVALSIVAGVFVVDTEPAEAFVDGGTVSGAAFVKGATVTLSSSGTVAGTSLTTGAVGTGTVAACAASVVCGAAVVGTAVLVAGGIWWLSSQGGTTPRYSTSGAVEYGAMSTIREPNDSKVFNHWVTLTWPADVPCTSCNIRYFYTVDEPSHPNIAATRDYAAANGYTHWSWTGGHYSGISKKLYSSGTNTYCEGDPDCTITLTGWIVYPFNWNDIVNGTNDVVACWGVGCDEVPSLDGMTDQSIVPQPKTARSTGRCIDPLTGQTADALPWVSDTYTSEVTLQAPLCPAGYRLTEVEIMETAEGGSPEVLIDVKTDLATLQQPCAAGSATVCDVELQRSLDGGTTWEECPAGDCDGDTLADPDTSTERCALMEAGVFVEALSADQCAQIARPDGSPAPQTLAAPEGNTGSFQTPLPPVGSAADCAPSGWNLLNPLAYVTGMACVFTWAFVPNSTILVGTLSGFVGEFQATGFGQLFTTSTGAITAFVDAFQDPGACTPSDEIGWETAGEFVGLTCENTDPNWPILYMAMQFGIMLSTAFALYRIAFAAFSPTGEE